MDTNIQTLYTYIHDATSVLQKMMSKNIETETLMKSLETKIKEQDKTIDDERQSHMSMREELLKTQYELENKLDVIKLRVIELEKENQRLFDESQSMRKVSQIIAFEKENGKLRKELELYRARIEELSHLQPKIDMAVNTDEIVENVEVKTEDDTIVEKVDDVKDKEGVLTRDNVIVEKVDDEKDKEGVLTQDNIVIEKVDDEKDVKTQDVENVTDPKDNNEKTDEKSAVENTEENTEEATEEADISVFEKKIKGKLYYVSDDDIMNIYTILPDGGIGEQVGRYEKESDGGKLKPKFY